MEFPKDLYYTKDHEWLRALDDSDECTVGITEFAQSELGDIVFVEVDEMDTNLKQEASFGTIEAVKTVAEMFMPVSGTVFEMNEELDDSPELVNDDPYGAGWLIKIRMSDRNELATLLSAADYADMVSS